LILPGPAKSNDCAGLPFGPDQSGSFRATLSAMSRFSSRREALRSAALWLPGAALAAAGCRSAAGQIAVFGPGQVLTLRAASSGARVLIVAGRKIGETVARRGPFVMNTEAELEQAYEDYRNGVLVSG